MIGAAGELEATAVRSLNRNLCAKLETLHPHYLTAGGVGGKLHHVNTEFVEAGEYCCWRLMRPGEGRLSIAGLTDLHF